MPIVDSFRFLSRFVEAHIHQAKYGHRYAVDVLGELHDAFPECVTVLSHTATMHLSLSDTDLARITLERVRDIDPYCLDNMVLNLHSSNVPGGML